MRRKILGFLLKNKKIDFWFLSSILGDIPSIAKILKKMRKNREIYIEDSMIFLTKKGKKIANHLKVKPETLPKTNKIYFKKLNRNFLKKFRKLGKKIKPNLNFDQYQLKPESVIKKVEYIKERGDLFNKKIICLGDDDLVAIALALTKLPKEIAVIDIDKSILEFEKKVLSKLNYNLVAVLHNLIEPIPERIKNKYDVFITEPPDTIKGISLFFSRGIDTLKKEGGVGYLGISSQTLSRKEKIIIEKNILKTNSLITDVLIKFELYESLGDEFEWIFNLPKGISLPKKPWFYSDLIRIEVLSKAKPLIKGKLKKSFSRFLQTDIYC